MGGPPPTGPDIAVSDQTHHRIRRGTFHRRLRHWLDAGGRGVVWIGGIATIVSVLAIFLYLLWEVVPLFRAADAEQLAEWMVEVPKRDLPSVTLVGMDGYQEVLFVLEGNQINFFTMPEGNPLVEAGAQLEIPGTVQSSVWVGQKGYVMSVATREGLAVPVEVKFQSVFQENRRRIVPEVKVHESLRIVPAGEELVWHAHTQNDRQQTIAALTTAGRLWLTSVEEPGEFAFSDEITVTQRHWVVPPQMGINQILLDHLGKRLVAGTQSGELVSWDLQEDSESPVRKVSVSDSPDPVTALGYLLGERTLIVGTESGRVTTWAPQEAGPAETDIPFRKIRSFMPHRSPVKIISWSQRDKGFMTADHLGAVHVHHATTGQTLLEFSPAGQETAGLRFSPKADGAVWLGSGGRVRVWAIDNPHPEVTFRSLFFPVLYEGYDAPEHIWQSSSGADEFEPKLGLIPLIFGTLKGTIYAMILAVPLAVMGAVYTAMFMHARLRSIVKPAIEIMAALPSVVLGFLAGLWFAPLLEDIFPAMVAIVGLLPVVIGMTCLGWQGLPKSWRSLDRYGMDLMVMMLVIVMTVAGCLVFNAFFESVLFGGDYKWWLSDRWGLVYDQRNAMVISFAMGFAVIPIIFSISEDSLSNVPRHLIAGSLALGATRWQTLVRLVIVSASPGIFSALMIGFGRAVGETMIVLMATGNTPILDWSMFNGFRTLSANIAVEMPEAPHGGTLYRVLFLSGLILFGFTFCINTMAELIRQRLRGKYSQY